MAVAKYMILYYNIMTAVKLNYNFELAAVCVAYSFDFRLVINNETVLLNIKFTFNRI